MRHEWFTVVFSNVPIRHETGFAAQVAGKLAAVVVLHDDRVLRAFKDVEYRFTVQRHEPANLELIGRDALLPQDPTCLFDHALSRAPAYQRNCGITWAP